jgi:hypothetical protein
MVVMAAEYPFLEILGTMVLFFAWVAWIWVAVTVLTDVFRRHDLSGWGKAAWTILVIVLPFLGVLIYMVAHSGGMAERAMGAAQAEQARFDAYARSVSNGGGPATEIDKAKRLHDSGAIDDREYEALKAKALA